MTGLYVFSLTFNVFEGFDKTYNSFSINDIDLLDKINDDLEKLFTSIQYKVWYSGFSKIPIGQTSIFSSSEIVIDLEKWNLKITPKEFIIGTVIPKVKKIFSSYSAPYDILYNGDDKNVNQFSSQKNGGGYRLVFGLGFKPVDADTTTTTTTKITATQSATSITTTTTTLPNGIIPQETSRGEIVDQNKSESNTSKNNITNNGIVNIFKATLKPNEISFNFSNNEKTKEEIKNGLGYIPIVWYNAYQIDAENIQYLSLFDDGIAPTLKLNFIDTLGIMKDKAFPLDDTRIIVFISSRSDLLKPIFIQFKISNFSNSDGLLSIEATMDVDSLYVKSFKSYSKMTSNQVLQEVCKEIGIGFNTNITDTNDKMTWINSGKKAYDFIEEIIDHAYVSDDSFVIGYIDHYYNYNFVDIQKELSRDITQELGVVSVGIAELFKVNDIKNISRLLLTNDASVAGSNLYFDTFKIMNNSTSVSLENGYTDIIKYYDSLDKSLLNFSVDSLNNNTDKSIVLKGAPQDETFYKANQNFVYGGKVDSDNSHKNFNYSKTQNSRNINDIQKVGMEIELSTPNYNIYRFQKIKIVLSSNTPTPASPMINQRLTGDWLIVDIKFMYYDGSLKQIVTLVKRELELSDDELEKELISSNRSNGKGKGYESGRGDYQNPTPPNINTNANNINTGNNKYITKYPELPFTDPPPAPDTLPFVKAVKYLNTRYGRAIGQAVFAILFAEASRNSDRTAFVSPGGHNYAGVQTDNARWGAPGIIGQYSRIDSGSKRRSFAMFATDESFLDFMANRATSKGFGKDASSDSWVTTYINKWWSPEAKKSYYKGTEVYNSKSSIYNSAVTRFDKFA